MSAEHNFAFGSYVLRTDPLRLLREGREVPLGSRALAILHALVQNHDQTLSKQRLIELVWRGGTANDNSVHVHINTLRNRIGHELIMTIAGAGYRLNAPVRILGRAPSMRVVGGNSRGRLIGRDAELAELADLAASHSLVTVVGPAGCGKSALAQALAGDAPQDEVAWVDVSTLTEAAQLPAAIAAAQRGEPVAAPAADDWLAALSARRLLLVLDNCERHVAAVAALCAQLALACDGLRVLATSQIPLQIAGEWTLRLGGLAVPPEDADSETARSFGAVELLVERGAQLHRGFALDDANAALIVHLTRLADGMPLAIELMAQHLDTTGSSPVEWNRLLLARTTGSAGARRDAPARHASLHASLQWSLALLDPAVRDALLPLAVFEDGFAAAAAAAVALAEGRDASASAAVMHGHLTALVRHSLLLVDWSGPRYRLPQLTRLQLLEELGMSGALRAARQQHARYYADYAQECRQQCEQRDGNRAAWQERLAAEGANLEAAVDWAVGPGQSASRALCLCAELAARWDLLGRYERGAQCIARALQLPGAEAEPSALRQRVLAAGAACALYRGHLPQAAQGFADAAAAARSAGAAAPLYRALLGTALCCALQGADGAADLALRQALQGFETLRDGDGIAACQLARVLIDIERDDLPAAQSDAQHALKVARAEGALTTSAEAHALLGEVLALRGDAAAARSHLQAAIDLATHLGFVRPRVHASGALAAVIAQQGGRDAAQRQLAAGLRAALQADLGVALLLTLARAAQWLMAEGDAQDALILLGAVEAARGRGEVHLAPWLVRANDELRERAARQVDAALQEVARTRGQALTLQQAGWHAAAALDLRSGRGGMLPFKRRTRHGPAEDQELRETVVGEGLG